MTSTADRHGGRRSVIRVFADTDRTDCGTLLNVATVDASNLSQELELQGAVEPEDPLEDSDTITVFCPIIELDKENNADGSVLPLTDVTYTLTLTVGDETEDVADSVAENVVVEGRPAESASRTRPTSASMAIRLPPTSTPPRGRSPGTWVTSPTARTS